MERRSVIIFMNTICKIGGAETWLYNLTSILQPYFDVTVVYNQANMEQLERLKVKHIHNDGKETFFCDILLNMFEGRPINIRARHTVQTVHSNYSEMPWYKFTPWDRTDSYIFASEASRLAFPYPLSVPSKVLLNPVYQPKLDFKKQRTDEYLHLMSATRLAEEKGGARMVRLCEMLREAGIAFDYRVWTSWSRKRFEEAFGPMPKEMELLDPKLDLQQEMINADYVVQLSDCEAFCYTIHEALAVHTPVLVTNWKGVDLSVRNGLNGYIFNMDMTGVSLKQLFKRPDTFGRLNNSNRAWIRYLKELPLKEVPDGWRASNYFLAK